MNPRSIGREAAIQRAKLQWWKGLTPKEAVKQQLETVELTIPWGIYHELAEKAFGRPVMTHEFADSETLWNELINKP